MSKGTLKNIAILILLSVWPSLCLGQNNDVEGTQLLLKYLPLEKQSINILKRKLKKDWAVEEIDLGFGARRITFGKGVAYTSIFIEAITINNKLATYEAGITSHSQEWPRMKAFVIETWRENEGPTFLEDEHKVYSTHTIKYNYAMLKRIYARSLGPMRDVSIPPDLELYYQYLTNPLNDITVGNGGCGYPPDIPLGKEAIDALLAAKRYDLIENVLRGFNPGGRIYAVTALLEAKRNGARLSFATDLTIKRIVNSPTPISTCTGCIVFRENGKAAIRKLQQ
jgi:hypothetical protein